MRTYIQNMQQNALPYHGSGNVAPVVTIVIRTISGQVAFTHTSEKNSLKETVELFLLKNRGDLLDSINLSNLDLSGVNLNNAVFNNSKFDNSVFYGSEICNSRFRNSSFNGSRFHNTKVYDSEFLQTEFYNAKFSNLEFSSPMFSNDLLKWFRVNGQLSAFDSYKADLWMKLIKIKKALPALREELKAGRVNGSSYGGVNSDFCGTIARTYGLNFNEIPGITADAESPVEQWFLLISRGMTPENSEAVKITIGWIDELGRNINAE